MRLIPTRATVAAFAHWSTTMTAFVAATLHQLLLRRFTPPAGATPPQLHAARPRPGFDFGDTLPMLFRSEGFAEDLCDSHPLNS
jgi:hypothetical protein